MSNTLGAIIIGICCLAMAACGWFTYKMETDPGFRHAALEVIYDIKHCMDPQPNYRAR